MTAALGMAFTAPAVVTASGEGPHVPQGPYRGIGKAGNASGSNEAIADPMDMDDRWVEPGGHPLPQVIRADSL